MVAEASFLLEEADPADVKSTLADMRARRRAAQPSGIKTFGSTFKNPEDERAEGRSAGVLLDQAGCRGLTVGGARLSPVHANFVENHDQATTADVVALMAEARRRVREEFGVELEAEVQTLGDVDGWDEEPSERRRRCRPAPARVLAPAGPVRAGAALGVIPPHIRRRAIVLLVLAGLLFGVYMVWLRDIGLVAVEKVEVTGLTGKDAAQATRRARGAWRATRPRCTWTGPPSTAWPSASRSSSPCGSRPTSRTACGSL